jgi:hypothetical protein
VFKISGAGVVAGVDVFIGYAVISRGDSDLPGGQHRLDASVAAGYFGDRVVLDSEFGRPHVDDLLRRGDACFELCREEPPVGGGDLESVFERPWGAGQDSRTVSRGCRAMSV